MKIHLKQKEIEAALRGYIAKQGITLAGRTLEIAFTSGRSGNGLTADISIEDAGIPGFDGNDDEAPDTAVSEEDDAANQAAPASKSTKPVLKAVATDVVVSIKDTNDERIVAAVVEERASPGLSFNDPVDTPAIKEPVKTGVSLFN